MTIAIWLLRVGIALVMVVFGINQLANTKAWLEYIPEFVRKISPLSPETQMRWHALGNIVFGLFLVAGNFYPLIAAWVALIWWLTILPFAFKKWDIGMRDLTTTISIIALIHLLSIK
jgi:uncharacterized membrane protein YphA (DoxX/SURF4 family)